MSDRIRKIRELGQSIWIDFISRELIRTGRLRELVQEGISGLTSNPTIFQKAIATGSDYDDQLRELARSGKSTTEIYEALAIRDIRDAADQLHPIYHDTRGRDGFVSIEVDPHLAHDTDGTIAQARRLHAAIDRPNVMIKVPATPEGLPAIRTLIAEGIHVNVTLIFAIDRYEQVAEAYVAALEQRRADQRAVGTVSSVASFFVSRVDTLVDKLLDERIAAGRKELAALKGQAAIANARIAYDRFRHIFGQDRFAKLRAAGAYVQRPLWASTSTKNPAYSDTKYVDNLIGPDTVNTLPPHTLEAVRDHGQVARTIDLDVEEAYATIERLEAAGIRMADVTDQLLRDGVKAFADSFDRLLADIDAKRRRFAGDAG